MHLTLTSVVFESYHDVVPVGTSCNLTLTSVVFELGKGGMLVW